MLQYNPKPSRVLGLFGLSLYTGEKDLKVLLNKYGQIERVQVVYDHQVSPSSLTYHPLPYLLLTYHPLNHPLPYLLHTILLHTFLSHTSYIPSSYIPSSYIPLTYHPLTYHPLPYLLHTILSHTSFPYPALSPSDWKVQGICLCLLQRS